MDTPDVEQLREIRVRVRARGMGAGNSTLDPFLDALRWVLTHGRPDATGADVTTWEGHRQIHETWRALRDAVGVGDGAT